MSDLITTIAKILLEEAGLSSDGVPTNDVGSGKVGGVGIPPNGEPGAGPRTHREIAKRRNPKLFAALRRGGTFEMSKFSEDKDDDVVCS
jgi:hypothetical protein